MRELLLLVFLLNAYKVCSMPYKADSNGHCRNPSREYHIEDSNLCCKKCQPGYRLRQECSETNDTWCVKCEADQYMENWNYARNCFPCTKCRDSKGQESSQLCSPTTASRCKCRQGMYCIMGFDHRLSCTECRKHSVCKAGYGVSVPGTAASNVKCKLCPAGTFSNTVSYTDPCRPHTECHQRPVVRKGNSTSDTVCEQGTGPESQIATKKPHNENVQTTARSIISTVPATLDVTSFLGVTNSSFVQITELIYPTKHPSPNTDTSTKLYAVIVGVIGVILVLILITCMLLVLYNKAKPKRDAVRFYPPVTANGNCEKGDKLKIRQSYIGDTPLTSFKVTSSEQHCLLQTGEAGSDHSQCSSKTESLTKTERSSSYDSIGPLQSTLALDNLNSALAESMTFLPSTEPTPLQPSVSTQSSQPTSPPIISPGTTSPHVNVNITLHIRNGSCGTPSVTPTDLMQTDCKLPFGEEEECSSIPQQEDGKQSLMSVQESEETAA